MGMDSGMTPADYAAVAGNGGGFGEGSSFFWIFALLILLFGCGGNGFGFGGSGSNQGLSGYEMGQLAGNNATKDTVYNTNLMQSIYTNQVNGLAEIERAQASNTLSIMGNSNDIEKRLNQQMCNDNIVMLNNFAATNSKLADMNCQTLRAIDATNYNLSQQSAEIQANCTANTQKVLDAISGNRIADMQNQINQLQLQSSLAGVVRYPTAITYTGGVSPFCGGSCGCGCGCA